LPRLPVRGGIRRRPRRQAPTSAATLERPALTNGQAVALIATVQLQRSHPPISSSNFPHYVRNQNTREDVGSSTRMQTAQQTILHDDDHPSHLALPVVPISIP